MNPPTPPARVSLVPDKLAVSVMALDIASANGPVPCWVYLSEGLRACGQREVAFALRRLPTEAADRYPHEPLHLFRTVLSLAEHGQAIETGAVMELGPPPLLNNPSIRGIGYLRMHPLLGLRAPEGALAAIALFGHEVDVARLHGLTRIVARLGLSTRQYPCPAWCERDRPALVSPACFNQTALSRAATIRISGTIATLEANQVSLLVPSRAIGQARAQLSQIPESAPFALLCDLDPHADACLVWQPGQQGPVGISPSGSSGHRVAGTYFLVVGDQASHSARILEDGFVVMTTAPAITAIRRALSSGTPLQFPPMGQIPGVSIAWDANAGAPMISGLGAAPAGELYLRMVTSIVDIATRLPSGALDPYLDAVEAALHDTIAALPPGPGQDLWMSISLLPEDRAEVQLRSRPGLDQGALKRIYDSLMAIRRPPVKYGPVELRGVMALWGGSGAPLDPG